MEEFSSNVLDEGEIPLVKQLYYVLTYMNKAFIKEREIGCTREKDADEESRTELKFCSRRSKAGIAVEEDKSNTAISTLKRTLDMTAPITDQYMEILDTSEDVLIRDFVSNQDEMKSLLKILSN